MPEPDPSAIQSQLAAARQALKSTRLSLVYVTTLLGSLSFISFSSNHFPSSSAIAFGLVGGRLIHEWLQARQERESARAMYPEFPLPAKASSPAPDATGRFVRRVFGPIVSLLGLCPVLWLVYRFFVVHDAPNKVLMLPSTVTTYVLVAAGWKWTRGEQLN